MTSVETVHVHSTQSTNGQYLKIFIQRVKKKNARSLEDNVGVNVESPKVSLSNVVDIHANCHIHLFESWKNI